MDSVLSQLKDLLELKDKAKLALPGVVFGFLLMIAFLPPRPIDWIPVVQSDSTHPPIKVPDDLLPGKHIPGFDSNEILSPYGNFAGRAFIPVREEPACTIDKYELKQASQLTGTLFQTNNAAARARQRALEEQNENLDRCLAAEKRLAGREEAVIAALNVDLTGLEVAQQTQAALAADYARLHSPLLSSALERSKLGESAVEAKRAEIRKEEQSIRNREWETGELTRWKKVVTDRLSEPGKLPALPARKVG